MTLTYRLTLYTPPPASTPIEITYGLVRATWRLGLTDPAQPFAPPGEAHFTLYNPNGLFSPARSWAVDALHTGFRLTFDALDPAFNGGSPVRLFTGEISAVTSEGHPHRARVTLHARTTDARLDDLPAAAPPFVQAGAGIGITALLDALPIRRLDQAAWWLLDSSAASALNTRTVLAAPFSSTCSLASGVSRFPYLDAGDASTCAAAIRRLVISEGGRWYASRHNVLTFTDRHADLRDAPPALTLAGDQTTVEYRWGDAVCGRVRVIATPRRVGSAGTVVWKPAVPLRFDPGTRTMTLPYSIDDRPVTLLGSPVVALLATTQPAGSMPAPLTVLVVGYEAAAVRVQVTNPIASAVYLSPASVVLGTPLLIGDPVIVEAYNEISANQLGGGVRTLAPPLIESVGEAEYLAAFTLLQDASPHGRIDRVTLPAAVPGALAVTMGSRVVVTAPAAQDSSAAWVVGERHTLDLADRPAHSITLVLSPADSAGLYWELNAAPLDSTSHLAY